MRGAVDVPFCLLNAVITTIFRYPEGDIHRDGIMASGRPRKTRKSVLGELMKNP
jgi:hypothetical protein